MRFSGPNKSNSKALEPAIGVSLLACFAISSVMADDKPTAEEALGPLCIPQVITIPGKPLEPGQTYDDIPIEYRAKIIETTDKDTIELSGDAIIIQGQRSIAADKLIYHRDTNNMSAEGKTITYGPSGSEIIADKLNINMQSFVGDAEGVDFKIADTDKPHEDPGKAYVNARGSSAKVYFQGEELITLEKADYTTCEEGNRDVVITANELVLDRITSTGTATNATIRFKNVPIFYWPRLSFPIGNKRKSGFLFPGIGHDKTSGYIFDVPYYWNISPQMDATIIPRYYSRRGGQLGGEFRYLGRSHQGEFRGQYMPDDDIFGDDRSAARYAHEQAFNEQWDGDVLLQYLSDEDYLDDLSNDINLSSSTHLAERVAALYGGDNWNFSASLLDYHTVDSSIAEANRPYKRLPQIVFGSDYGKLDSGIKLDIEGEIVDFDQDDRVTGTRVDLTPSIAFPMRRSYGFVKPKLDWRYTTYNLTDQPTGNPDSPTRSLPVVSVDSGLYFDRPTSWGGREHNQTLEPRLKYVYIPFEAQDDLPIFDTGQGNLNNFGNIYRNNRFFGPDRVGDTSKIILGLISRYVDEESGEEPLKFSLGQIYFLKDQRVGLTGEIDFDNSASDFLSELEVDITRNLSSYAYLQMDEDVAQVEEGKLDFIYSQHARRWGSLRYRFTRDSSEQVDFRTNWAFNRAWSLQLENNYDVDNSENLRTLVGFGYSSCCWGISAVGQRRFDTNSDEKDSFLLTFELRGIASITQRF